MDKNALDARVDRVLGLVRRGNLRSALRSTRLGDLAGPALKTYLVVRLAVLVAVLVMHHLRPSYDLSGLVGAWDGGWYLRIARYGYPAHLSHVFNSWAFFPLMPAIVKVVHSAFPFLTWNEAGSLVSLLAGGVFIVAATVLAGDVFGRERGRQSGMVLASFPGLFLAVLAYAEPVALSFAALSLISLGRRRYELAGVLSSMAMLASPLTLPLGFVIVVVVIKRCGRSGLLPAFLAVTAPITWALVAWARTGKFTALLLAQGPWGHHITWPWRAGTFGMLTSIIGARDIFWMTLGSSIVAIVLIWRAVHHRTVGVGPWWTYSAIVLAVVACDTTLWISPRFLLDAFPLILSAGATLNRRLVWPAIVLGALLTVVVFLAYTRFGDLFAQP